jgi:hypothetical protein
VPGQARNKGCWRWCGPAKNTPNTGGISIPLALVSRDSPPWPSLPLLHRPLRGHRVAVCVLLQSIRRKSRLSRVCMDSRRRIVQWARRLPCAACMLAAGVRGSADIRLEKLRRLIVRGPAWHGMAWPSLLPLVLLQYFCWTQGLGQLARRRKRNHDLEPARGCANTSSFRLSIRRSRRSEQQPYSQPRQYSHSRLAVPKVPAADADAAAGLASSLSMGPSDVQHGRGLQVITFSLTLSLSMPAGSACERSDKPPAAPVRPSPVNSILRLL